MMFPEAMSLPAVMSREEAYALVGGELPAWVPWISPVVGMVVASPAKGGVAMNSPLPPGVVDPWEGENSQP